MTKVPNGVETLPKILIARVGLRCTNVTDRRTDDGRTSDDVNITFAEMFTISDRFICFILTVKQSAAMVGGLCFDCND